MRKERGLTGREICKLIENNSLMDVPIWNPDDSIEYATLQFIIKDSTDEDPWYHIVNCNVVTGEVEHYINRVES